MKRYANTYMTIQEQVAFAWKYRDHFEEIRLQNINENIRRYRGEIGGKFRNAWEELANMPDAKP